MTKATALMLGRIAYLKGKTNAPLADKEFSRKLEAKLGHNADPTFVLLNYWNRGWFEEFRIVIDGIRLRRRRAR
jgi:hypothetical protein